MLQRWSCDQTREDSVICFTQMAKVLIRYRVILGFLFKMVDLAYNLPASLS